MKFSKKWLQGYVVEELPANEVIIDQLSKKAFEVEDVEEYVGSVSGEVDSVFEIKILPNRAHDCLGHMGMARELAAIFNLTLKPEAEYTWGSPAKNKDLEILIQKYKSQTERGLEFPSEVQVFVEDVKVCTRFASMRVHGVKVGPSPVWLRERLEAIGQRSINNIVDITNYVQFSINKPMHAYDAQNINGRLCALFAHDGEKLVTLDDKELELDSQTLIIADGGVEGNAHSKALGLAGIKGGKFSGISEATNEVILESANFNPDMTRKTSQKYNIRTDASKRFENGIADSLVTDGLYMTARLILEVAGDENTTISHLTDTKKDGEKFARVVTSFTEISRVAGKEIPQQFVLDILTNLGFVVTQDDDQLAVIAPPERLDMSISDDVAEEVVRLYGFDNIESKPIVLNRKGQVNAVLAVETEIRKALIQKGFSEVFGYAFTDKGEVEIALPLAADKAFLRTELSSGAQGMFDKNVLLTPLYETELISIFEFGNVFVSGVEERRCILVKDDGKKKSRFEQDLQGCLAQIKTIFGLSDLKVINQKDKPAMVEFSISEIIQNIDQARLRELQDNFAKAPYELPTSRYKPFSVYPFIARDVSMWVPSKVKFEDIKKDLEALQLQNYLKSYVFDTYTPTDEANSSFGKTSVAFRLIFQSFERTLTDIEVETEMQKVYALLKSKSFEVR
jgi:phenylalanyl-tRNA synthetase beta chain